MSAPPPPSVRASAALPPGRVSEDYSIILHQGDGPCVLRFWSAEKADFPEQVLLTEISRIETLKSPGCEPKIFYDEPNADHGTWTGGSLPKPGHEAEFSETPLHFVDLDNDGYLDLDYYVVHSPYLDEHPLFHFVPKTRTFD